MAALTRARLIHKRRIDECVEIIVGLVFYVDLGTDLGASDRASLRQFMTAFRLELLGLVHSVLVLALVHHLLRFVVLTYVRLHYLAQVWLAQLNLLGRDRRFFRSVQVGREGPRTTLFRAALLAVVTSRQRKLR